MRFCKSLGKHNLFMILPSSLSKTGLGCSCGHQSRGHTFIIRSCFSNSFFDPQHHPLRPPLQAERDAIKVEDEKRVGEYLALAQQLRKLRKDLTSLVHAPKHALPFLQQGRLVRVAPPEQAVASVHRWVCVAEHDICSRVVAEWTACRFSSMSVT